ncbi:hypothetical protein D7322_20550 [Sphingobacterium puteale]|uniref:Uncharacterized protein n=1 Tax=Sphingobacterium puteale TaxID=2420510 RepID=A0A420VTL7_9SPHI|nr:hypothetical protein D7322_20550 [Sphingobacterium puteale]
MPEIGSFDLVADDVFLPFFKYLIVKRLALGLVLFVQIIISYITKDRELVSQPLNCIQYET